jgi:(E)-4-hydroxy-3-methylbut-2-enyl-diphosphate synthase
MWKRPLTSISPELTDSIKQLQLLGCDLLRLAVPDHEAAIFVGELAQQVSLPIVADIHFDYRLALACLEYPVAKIRINPGNIGASWKVREVVSRAKEKNVPLRVGVNSGSLPASLRNEPNTAVAMVKAAEGELEQLQALDFDQVIVSLKSSDVETTVEANRIFAEKYRYPLHIGVTEAGPLIAGVVKNSVGIARLLEEHIGSTIRVSLSESPEKEIITAREILAACGKQRRPGAAIISCPMCGRASFDVHAFIHALENELYKIRQNITVAVMGCVVNGPGEARHADIGISGSKQGAVIFKKGKIVKKVAIEEAENEFRREIQPFIETGYEKTD